MSPRSIRGKPEQLSQSAVEGSAAVVPDGCDEISLSGRLSSTGASWRQSEGTCAPVDDDDQAGEETVLWRLGHMPEKRAASGRQGASSCS